MIKRLVITRGGQVSVPAAVRRRWHTRAVLVDDRGDHLIVRPAPENPVAAVRGALAGELRGIDIAGLRRDAREEEVEREERR